MSHLAEDSSSKIACAMTTSSTSGFCAFSRTVIELDRNVCSFWTLWVSFHLLTKKLSPLYERPICFVVIPRKRLEEDEAFQLSLTLPEPNLEHIGGRVSPPQLYFNQ